MDTGLDQEEIDELKLIRWWSQCEAGIKPTVFGLSVDRLRELAEADKDGRCVILPEPVSDTYKLKPLEKSELFEMRGTAVLVAHTDGSPVMNGMDRVAAVLDTTPIYGEAKLGIMAIYGRLLTLGDSEYGKTWVAYNYRAEAEKALEGEKDNE